MYDEGNRDTVRLLGMSVQMLRYRMCKYGIQRPKKSSYMQHYDDEQKVVQTNRKLFKMNNFLFK